MTEYQANRVFTPTSPATNTFVERSIKINNHLVDSLNTPGKQIVLYGHSGCGKTTLLTNKLNQTYENAIITRCMSGMGFDAIILNAFDQLGNFYKESSTVKGFKIAPSVIINYNELKASINLGEITNQTSTTSRSFVPPQLTPQRLGSFFGEIHTCWVLEDFHKIRVEEKGKIAQVMKIFMDMSEIYPDLKIVAIGAVGSAREVILYDREMNNRVSEIFIPHMTSFEIESIIKSGERLLNLKFSNRARKKIVKYSCGLPSVCHQLCLNICFNKRIIKTAKDPITINEGDLDGAIGKYLDEKSDTLKAEYDKAIKIPNKVKINISKRILDSSVILNDEFSSDLLYASINDKQIRRKKFEEVLSELCTVNRSEILVYDENSNLYRFNNLFLKAYTLLQAQNDPNATVEPEPVSPITRDQKIVSRLLEIIEKEIYDGYDELFIEDY